jgi:inner membrane transporter RhtA
MGRDRVTAAGSPNGDLPTARSRSVGIAATLVSAAANQAGASIGALAFPSIGPIGVVVVRQFVAAAVLLPLVRPRVWRFNRHQLWPVLLLALVFGTMNLCLYYSIDRIGLGLAVTLEFLGPLGVALGGSRTRSAIFCAIGAGVGVVAITHPQASTDYLGVGLGLVAAGCWAAYILLQRTIGRRFAGSEGTAAATGVSAIVFLPIGIVLFLTHPPTLFGILCAIGAGILASAVPMLADLFTLRRVPTNLFGILLSINPIFAAAFGAIVLHQGLEAIEWIGIALIVGANVAAFALNRTRQSRTAAGTAIEPDAL